MDATEQKLKALDAFKDWSNYLLVTTVAALGWTAGKDAGHFCLPWMKSASILFFALSTVFAILTLALVPHVAQGIKETDGKAKSIYHIYWQGWWVKLRLTRLCLPQHLFFLAGILLYAIGTAFHRYAVLWLIGLPLAILLGLLLLGNYRHPKGD